MANDDKIFYIVNASFFGTDDRMLCVSDGQFYSISIRGKESDKHAPYPCFAVSMQEIIAFRNELDLFINKFHEKPEAEIKAAEKDPIASELEAIMKKRYAS